MNGNTKFTHYKGRKCGNSQNASTSSNFSKISCFRCIDFYLKINLEQFLNEVNFKEYRFNKSRSRGQHNFMLVNYDNKSFRTFNNLDFSNYSTKDFIQSNQTILVLEKQSLQIGTTLETYEKSIHYLSKIVDDVKIITKIVSYELSNKQTIRMLIVRSNIGKVLTEGFIRFACQVGDRLIYNNMDFMTSIKKVYTDTQQTRRGVLKPLAKIWASNSVGYFLNNTFVLEQLKTQDKDELKALFVEHFKPLANRYEEGFSVGYYVSLIADIRHYNN